MPAARAFVVLCLCSVTALGVGLGAVPAQAATPPPDLATAATFAVLAGSTVTNTGPTMISGDLGVSPGTAVTGFGPGTVLGGTIHSADAVALTAQDDVTTAYNTAAGLPPTGQITADLGGQSLVPGVYAGPTLSLTGSLTLDAKGDANAVFVFQSGSTLITASASSVVLLGGASACNVFWQVGSSATLGTTSTLVGSVLALASITADTGARVQGRLLARSGAVTLDSNTVTRPLCVAGVVPVPVVVPSVSPSPTPSPTPSATASASPVAPATTPSSSSTPGSATPGGAPSAPVPTASSTPKPAATPSAVPAATTVLGPAVPNGRRTTQATPTVAPAPTSTEAGLVRASVASERATTSQLPLTGVPLATLTQLALLLMALGGLAVTVASAPRGSHTER